MQLPHPLELCNNAYMQICKGTLRWNCLLHCILTHHIALGTRGLLDDLDDAIDADALDASDAIDTPLDDV
jgi:hypothetical protein